MIIQLIFLSTLLVRCFSFFYINKIKNTFNKKKRRIYLLIPFTRYTDLSHMLSLIWSGTIIFFKIEPSSAFTVTTWVVLCNTTIGYWIFKKELESNELPDNNKLYYKVCNFIGHGGINILMYFRPTNYTYNFSDIIYPLVLSFFWLIFVMQIFYYISGEPVYPFLDKKVEITFKIKIILILCINSLIMGFIGRLI